MQAVEITKEHARRIFLEAQGLVFTPRALRARPLRAIIEHLGYVQLDTLNVVERAHHHVLWSRASKYKPGADDELMRAGTIFEYWSHAAALLPMRDYRFSLPRKELYRRSLPKSSDAVKMRRFVLDRIRNEGPLRSSDFEHVKGRGSWWSWKPAKHALEELFHSGDLMVLRRQNFQKVYEVSHRVLPDTVDTRTPRWEEYSRYLIDRALQSSGLASVDEIAYLRKSDAKRTIVKELQHMTEAGEVVELRVEGIDTRFFARQGALRHRRTRAGAEVHAMLLSPFDNAVIQRRRLLDFFGFDFRIECYVPQPKRVFGYFCLPILLGDRFVGRADCKADRATAQLNVLSLSIESTLKDADLHAIADALSSFAHFNRCNTVRIQKSSNRESMRRLHLLLKDARKDIHQS